MEEQPSEELISNRIEAPNTPLIVERLQTQVKNSSLFQEGELTEDRVTEAREKIKKEEPYFHLHNYSSTSEADFQTVPLKRIVGGVSPSFHFWGEEYRNRRGRHEAIISELITEAKKEDNEPFHDAVNHTFHLDDGRPSERIRLVKIDGPAGEVFFISDGTHRVSACKALELEHVPCQAEEGQIKEVYSRDKEDKIWWEELKRAGLIKGEINEAPIELGLEEETKMYWLEIEEAVVPWVSYSFEDFFRFNRRYNEIYPGAFSNLRGLSEKPSPIPEEVFLDSVEFNRFIQEK